MRTFIAVVEEGGLSAAARRLHISQPAVSQTVNALERELGVVLLVRGKSGVSATDAGMALLTEARSLLAQYDKAVGLVVGNTVAPERVLRLGIPLELPDDVLVPAFADLARHYPDTTVRPRHMATAEQHEALLAGELDLGLMRERPMGEQLDAMLVVEERLGVILTADKTAELADEEGMRLDALAGLEWVGFPRETSPAWYDEIAAVLRSHGVDLLVTGGAYGRTGLPQVKFAGVSTGRAFALVPPEWPHTLPDYVRWSPLIGYPLVRRTWAVWPADATRRDLGHLVAALGYRTLG
ncbi:MAG TPA: LysR family transcriptional regulator [Kribbella sp.]|uniref:LysR substrate-binding domain-containing protein n=1 Tax=Kribbella sp. TaxID=1871183 RepID=UPI002D79D027|nr:LysR family transcriptional regulator [Kribbella sp.]HET6294372.1 LysR family transcriptional regulator [Kribbella sp.]